MPDILAETYTSKIARLRHPPADHKMAENYVKAIVDCLIDKGYNIKPDFSDVGDAKTLWKDFKEVIKELCYEYAYESNARNADAFAEGVWDEIETEQIYQYYKGTPKFDPAHHISLDDMDAAILRVSKVHQAQNQANQDSGINTVFESATWEYSPDWDELSIKEKIILLLIKSPKDIKTWSIVNMWEDDHQTCLGVNVNGVEIAFNWIGDTDEDEEPDANLVRSKKDVFDNIRHVIENMANDGKGVTPEQEKELFDVYNATLQANKDSGINTDF